MLHVTQQSGMGRGLYPSLLSTKTVRAVTGSPNGGTIECGEGDNRYALIAFYVASAVPAGSLVAIGGVNCTVARYDARFFGSGTYDNISMQYLDLSANSLEGTQNVTIAAPGFAAMVAGCVVRGLSTPLFTSGGISTGTSYSRTMQIMPQRGAVAACLFTRDTGQAFSSDNLDILSQSFAGSARIAIALQLGKAGTTNVLSTPSSTVLGQTLASFR